MVRRRDLRRTRMLVRRAVNGRSTTACAGGLLKAQGTRAELPAQRRTGNGCSRLPWGDGRGRGHVLLQIRASSDSLEELAKKMGLPRVPRAAPSAQPSRTSGSPTSAGGRAPTRCCQGGRGSSWGSRDALAGRPADRTTVATARPLGDSPGAPSPASPHEADHSSRPPARSVAGAPGSAPRRPVWLPCPAPPRRRCGRYRRIRRRRGPGASSV